MTGFVRDPSCIRCTVIHTATLLQPMPKIAQGAFSASEYHAENYSLPLTRLRIPLCSESKGGESFEATYGSMDF